MLRPSRITSEVQQVFSPVEIIKPGNVPGDDDNWQLKIVGDNLQILYKVGVTWKKSEVMVRQ